jgi:hypothetical protein
VRFLAFVAAALGLAPPGADATVRTVSAGRDGASYVVVLWTRSTEPLPPSGIRIWRLGSKRLHLLYRRRFPEDTYADVRTGDVTRDHVPELLLEEPNSGSGNCGVRRVLDLRASRAREIWRRYTCDTYVSLSHHRLVVVAGDYLPGDAHCCPMFSSRREFVWRRSRFRRVRHTIFWNCISCYDPRDLPPFRPFREAFWDRHRGIAIARHPWRIGRTTDGGFTWEAEAVARWRLEAPHTNGLRRATVTFRCDRCALRYRRAYTRDFGETWTVSP